MKRIALTIALLLTPALAHARGYSPIACGMDANHNGTFGEAADCTMCNGNAADDPVTYTQWYISADTPTGVDNTSCGTTVAPCKTLNYAMTVRANFADATPDAFCGHGTFTTELTTGNLIRTGQAGTYSVAPTGHQVLTWRYATKPTIIMAWDKDGDGDYFPHDTDDNFTIDGCPVQGRQLFTLNESGGASYFEIAHLRAKNYGSLACVGAMTQASHPNMGILNANGGPNVAGIHDAEFIDFGRGQAKFSEGALIRMFTNSGSGAQIWNYFYVRNVYMPDHGSYVIRGGVGDTGNERGPLRFENITETSRGCGTCTAPTYGTDNKVIQSASAYKLWALLGASPIPNGTYTGDNNGVEILDSVMDTQSGLWGSPSNASTDGYGFQDCQQNVYIVGNEWIDWKRAVKGEQDDGFCNVRQKKNLVVDKNIIRQTASSPFKTSSSAIGVYMEPLASSGTDPSSWTDGVKITNNFFDQNTGAGVLFEDGAPGVVTRTLPYIIDNNTFNGNTASTKAALTFNCLDNNGGATCLNYGSTSSYPTIKIRSNLFSGINASQRNIRMAQLFVDNSPAITLANNGYDPDAIFTWGGDTNYSGWVSSSGETGSAQGTPTYVGAPDLHFSVGTSFGVNGGLCTADVPKDIDGDTRPIGATCDRGADETTAPAGSPGNVAFSTDTYNVIEAGTTATTYNLSVCRNSGTLGAASVRVRNLSGNGTATPGTCATNDYATFSNVTVSWADGVGGCQDVPVSVCNDTNVESDETIIFTLDTFVVASAGSVTNAVMNVMDNDIGAAPQFDSATNVCRTTDNTTFTLASVPAPTGTNRAIVCVLGTRSQITSASGVPNGRTCDTTGAVMTWGTEALAKLSQARVAGSGNSARDHCVSIWQLLAPVAAGPATVTVTLGQTQQSAAISCIALHDVFQTTAPEVTATPIQSGTGTSPGSIDITTIATNSLIVDGILVGANVTSYTPGASQTERYDNACESAMTFSSSTKEQATAGATTMSHTWTGDGITTSMVAVSYKGIAAVCSPTCGNDVRECGTEFCDDGGTTNADGCSSACLIESGWLCNEAQPDICTPICGDGVDVGAAEACDDGNGINTDMCTNSCLVATCGDGIVCSAPACNTATGAAPEQCDGTSVAQCASGVCTGGCICTSPLPTTQACCLVPSQTTCEDLTTSACANSGGVSKGASTDCDPTPCTTTTAAPTTTSTTSTTTSTTMTTTTVVNIGGDSAINVH